MEQQEPGALISSRVGLSMDSVIPFSSQRSDPQVRAALPPTPTTPLGDDKEAGMPSEKLSSVPSAFSSLVGGGVLSDVIPISKMGKLSLQITHLFSKIAKCPLCAKGCSGHWGHIGGQDKQSQPSGDSQPQMEPGFSLLLIAARRKQSQAGSGLRERRHPEDCGRDL